MAAGSYVPFHFQKGVTSLSWNMSCTAADLFYSVYETAQWVQVDSSMVYDATGGHDNPMWIQCLDTYRDLAPNSSRVLPLKASRAHTFVMWNFQGKTPARVSGETPT